MARIIVDGYNAIRRIPRLTEAEAEGLAQGRFALLMALEEYGARTGFEITVVFDGSGRPADDHALESRERFAGIDVIYSEKGRSADMEIERLLMQYARERLENPCDLLLITDDNDLRDHALHFGAFSVSQDELAAAMESGRRISY